MGIENLLAQNEGKTLEFKRDLSSPKPALRTIIAFANATGGTLLLGVEDKTRTVCGIKNPLNVEERLANLIADCIAPRVLPSIEIIPWRKTYLIAVEVYPSAGKPHYLKENGVTNGTYVRVGSTNRRADATLIAELRRSAIHASYDEEPIPSIDSEAIDFRAASESFASIKRLKRSDLSTLKIVTEYQGKNVPTNGGMVLFGRDRHEYFPDAWIHCGKFSGVDKRKILDNLEVHSYLPTAVEEAIGFVQKHATKGIRINAVKHEAQWSIPLGAVREAIINAVVHADYSQRGSPIRVSLFDNRIEIENPGLLVSGLTISDIKLGISKLRNRVVGRVFKELGLIEQWGSGVQRMMASCEEMGLELPMFEELATHFRVTLSTIPVKGMKLDHTDMSIRELLAQRGPLSTRDIATHVGLTTRAVRDRLASLKKRGIVVVLGQGRNDPKRRYALAEQ